MSASIELPESTSAEEPVEIRYPRSKLLGEVRLAMSADDAKDKASMIVIGKPIFPVNSKPTLGFMTRPRSRRCW